MNKKLLFWVASCFVFLYSCVPLSETSAPTQTFTPVSVHPAPVVINAPPSNFNIPMPEIDSNGSLRLNNIYINNDVVHCFPGYIEEINYSPNYTYALVLIGCMEELNQLFLFRADGYGLLREITADSWEILLGNKYSWSPDGNSVVYFRAACCTDAHSEVQAGLVRYDVKTADRKLLSAYPIIFYPENPPVWSLDGNWIAFLSPEFQDYPCVSLYVIGRSGSALWKFEKFCVDDVSWKHAKLSWEFDDASTHVLRLEYTSSGKILKSLYYVRNDTPVSSSVIFLTPVPDTQQP